MDAQLEKLIDLALADGVLTDKERQVLTRKALELGVDQDEFEMILDGKLHLAQKAVAPPQAAVAESGMLHSQKVGDIRKCPSCGAPSQSFATKCPECGHEYRNMASTSSVQRLFEMINDLERSRTEDTSNPIAAIGKAYSNLFSGKGIYGRDKTESQKSELIMNFPIPNSKEDILEFLSMAIPRAKKKGGFWGGHGSEVAEVTAHNKLVPVWHSKCHQIVMKARFSMKEDPKTLEEIEYYAKQIDIK